MTRHDRASTAPASDPTTTQTALEHPRWDAVIIGGGAAGLSAALILSRARRRVLVLDAGAPRNRFAPHMHGVLSRDGYSPLDLVHDGRREVLAADGVIEAARVTQTNAVADGFELITEAGVRISARRLIVATGTRDVLPEIDGIAEQWGRGVVACPYCDGYEAAGRRIGVLLGSATGIHKAHMLRSYSSDVTVFTALADAVPEADRRVLEQRGIRLEDRGVSHLVSDEDRMSGLALADGTVTPIDALFAEPRLVPLDEPLRQLGAARTDTPFGTWPIVDEYGRTSIPGVWAVGNTANPAALVPIAMGSGATAALALNGEFVADEVARAAAAVIAEHEAVAR